MSSALPEDQWEMIADDQEEENHAVNANVDDHVFIMTGAASTEAVVHKSECGRPRSATIGGDAPDLVLVSRSSTAGRRNDSRMDLSGSSTTSSKRVLRRCASTPDLLVGDNAHEVIVEDESDEESDDGDECSEEDAELIEAANEEDVEAELEESFEVLSDKNREDPAVTDGGDEVEEEPVMIVEDNDSAGGEEESATLVSTPSMGTSTSWTMASPPRVPSAGVWGMKKSPSFKDMLAKNIGGGDSAGVFGKDKAITEARLRDSHRRHHLRVRTKPKLVITVDPAGRKTMKHAHSTGDLNKMLTAVEEGHESSLGQGGRNRRTMRKQLSAMMEEDEMEGDFVIGRGSGGGTDGGGRVEVMGDTDAMDYYHRKEQGSRSTSNKKKERPDEAKRREIIMHKKEMQRKKQQLSQKGGGDNDAGGGGKKKKKNDKGFGGKKERRRL